MAHAVLLAHLPLLRIEPQQVAIGGGILARYPFELYDNLSLGAFEGHKPAYELTDPVVFMVEGEIDDPIFAPGLLDQRGSFEIKVPLDGWEGLLPQLRLGLIARFQDLIDHVRSALLLAAPAAALPSQRLSWAFLYAEDAHIELSSDQRSGAVRVQGPADQEYLFFPEAAGPPLSADTLARAVSLAPAIDRIWKHGDLSAALRTLHLAASPTLSPQEQLTVTVMGLEALLLPEVRSGLKETFARRLAQLLANDEASRDAVHDAARLLYDYRSAGIHGGMLPPTIASEEVVAQAHAQQFLAAAIEQLDAAISDGASIESIRQQLDEASPPARRAPVLVRPPEGLRPLQRLTALRAHEFWSFSGAALEVPEGAAWCWAPLIGLTAPVEFAVAGPPNVFFTSVTANDLVSLEPKDIRRDFVAQMRMASQTSACLGIWEEAPEGDSNDVFDRLLRLRDMAVAGLRLAGFSRFFDPDLLGAYLNVGSMRTRRASVFRQTILGRSVSDSGEAVEPDDQATITGHWQRLREYDARARHSEVDHVLTLFRRAHDREFQPLQTCAVLALAALEAMLGRFRSSKDRIQLEMLVTAICGSQLEAVQWFTAEGRSFRNAVAHGSWSPAGETGPIDHLLVILRGLVPVFVDKWTAVDDRTGRRPGRVMIDAAQAQLTV